MNKNLKKVISSVAALTMVASSVAAFAVDFPDVESTASYAQAVQELSALDVISGYEDGTFGPDKLVTRAEITKMIVDGTNELAEKHGLSIYCKNVGSIWLLQFGSGKPLSDLRDSYHMVDKKAYQFLYKEALARGVRLHPLRGRSNVSTAHTEEDVKYTLDVFDEVFGMLKNR